MIHFTTIHFMALSAALLLSITCVYSTEATYPLHSEYHDQIRDPYIIYQFPNTTWIENIAVRSNGKILVDVLDRPEFYQVDPFTQPATATLIHRFEQYAGGLLGIAELEKDEFAVVLGNYSVVTGTPIPGSFAIWRVDFRGHKPCVSKISDIPEAAMLNGMASLNSQAVLIADSKLGVVFYLDTSTGKHRIAIDHKSFKPLQNKIVTIGINGVKVHNGYLYYTNSFSGTLMRVRAHPYTGEAIGAFETVGPQPWIADDIAVAKDGTTYIAGSIANFVTKVSPSGKSVVIAGDANSSVVAGATAVAFGRTTRDMGLLYVSDNGGMAAPVNGTFIEGGKITAVRI